MTRLALLFVAQGWSAVTPRICGSMMDQYGIPPSSMVGSVSRARSVTLVTLATTVIVIYDWLICLSNEVELIWRAKWSMGRWLYLFTRYMTFVSVMLTTIDFFADHLSTEQCVGFYNAGFWFTMILLPTTELIPIWRTYGLWNQYKPIRNVLLFLWAGWVVCMLYSHIRVTQTLHFGRNLPSVQGCHLLSWTNAIAWMFAPLAVLETVIVILTAIKCIHHIRHNPNSLITTLYRDGLIFFTVLLADCIVTVVVTFAAPLAFSQMFSAVLRAMHSVLYCRVVLNLRDTAQRESRMPSRISDVRFWGRSGTLQVVYELEDLQQDSSTSTAPTDSADPTDATKLNV